MEADGDDTDWDRVIPGVMPDGDVEVGYFLKQKAWGKGYATEACRRLLRFAFEETPLQEIVATLDDDHEVSKRVLEKSGLSCRGRRMAYGEDCPDWRIGRAQWLALVAEGRS
jgi:RimJ/RimL family protein N-acetyltransferase